MVNDLVHRQHQSIRHVQCGIDSIGCRSHLIKCLDLEVAALESKQPVGGSVA